MLTQNQKSKMVCDVNKLKEYFHKTRNKLKVSLDVNNNTHENIKKDVKFRFSKIRR